MGKHKRKPPVFAGNVARQAQARYLRTKKPESERVQENREAAGHVICLCFMVALNDRYGIGEGRLQREAAEIVVKCYALGTHKALGFGRERLEETIKATEAVFREFGEWAKGGDYFGYAMLARRLTEILGEPVEVDESKADEPIFSRTLD